MRVWFVFVAVALVVLGPGAPVEGARILAVWPMEAPSHFFLGNRLMKALAERGHQVTMISAFPQKTPVKNYKDITLVGVKEKLMEFMSTGGEKLDLMGMGSLPPWQQALFTSWVGTKATDIALDNPSVQQLLRSGEKFDLVIFEMFHTEQLYGLAHHYDCPVIVLSTIGSSAWTNPLVGNPAPSSYVPDLFMQYPSHMTLWQRMHNSVHNLFIEAYRRWWYFPQLDVEMHRRFPDAPPLQQLMYERTAMVLLNSHPALSDPKPHVPAMVEIGGYHIDDPKPLPKDLKNLMDNAKHGVILFSMGSNLKSTELNPEIRDALLKSFGKLKQQVIWKWEDENLPGKPDNVKIMKWCPQNDIMAHPNLKLFITHGGLLSTTEALHHGVPVIGIPIFGDQKFNVAMTQRKGYGIGIEYNDLTEERLTSALTEILTNPMFRENARRGSQVLRDQPVRPIDAAVFWTEHVIRHRGAPHLRSAAMDLEWYQLYSLDIIALVVVADLVFLAVLYYVCRKLLCGRRTQETSKKDAKKKKN